MLERRALVIGAEPEVKAMLCRILEPKQWRLQEAADNAAALQLVEAAKFDLILTSQRTSGKEDIELLRKIRRIHPHTRVIILAETKTPADVLVAIQESAFSYFQTLLAGITQFIGAGGY